MRIFSLCRSINHYSSLLTATRTLATIQPPRRSFPLKQHRCMVQGSAAVSVEEERPASTFEGSKPYFSEPRENLDHQEFPSAKNPLNGQTWRQFLTSDDKTIVCVHPAKSVPIQDTKVQYYYKLRIHGRCIVLWRFFAKRKGMSKQQCRFSFPQCSIAQLRDY